MSAPFNVLSAKILVVDDQDANVKLLEYMLLDAGYTSVTSTTDPRKVHDLYRANRYDVVLLDLHMPYMDGFEVIEALKTLEPEHYLQILVITAQPDHKLRALTAGAKDFVSKPFDHVEVLTRIRNMVTNSMLNKHLRASQDALERRSAELIAANRFMDSVIENIPNMIVVKSAQGLKYVRVNRAGEAMIGRSREEMFDKSDRDLFSEEEARSIEAQDREVLASQTVIDIAEESIRTPDRGTRILHTKRVPVLDEFGRPTHVLSISEDVTERIGQDKEIRRLNAVLAERAQHLEASNEQKQAALNYAAKFDLLTGAPNLSSFLDAVGKELESHVRANEKLALVIMDIRHFGRINDSFGKAMGDRILTLVAKRLGNGRHVGCARISGNSFALALAHLQNDGEVAPALMKHVLQPFHQPFLVDGHELTVAARCGIALFPGDGLTTEEVFRNAEAALKKAKLQGDEYVFYTSDLNARVVEQISLESELRKAISDQHFVLHYQPKVDTATRRLTGFEALIRLNSPTRGLVPPCEFIPILEETGMILEVGSWVLRQAAGDYCEWRRKGLNPPAIAVNISAIQLRQPDFVESVWEMCRKGYEEAPAINLEITESVLMDDIDRIIPALQKLRDAGYGISIDDFGTGYSSFSYLTKIPLTEIKIDRSFILNLDTEQNRNIVSTIILLAHSLKLSVVAEGVETEYQSIQLHSMQCDETQGFLTGKPMPKEAAELLLAQASTPTP
jgi:diguanylate cyclase (GGDEF)-like protein/PAS domain S-box-containing protein